MDRFQSAKCDSLATDAGNGLALREPSAARRISAAIVKAALGLIFVGLALALVYQLILDKQAYDSLLQKYNGLMAEQENHMPTAPTVTLVHRAMDSATPSYVYTTTTVTKGTTITVQTTAPSSSRPASSAFSASLNLPSTGPEQCTAGTPQTVTVTVTGGASSSAEAFTSASPSSLPPITVLETRVTTATIFVTASRLVSPQAQTLTITATSTEMETSTEVATVHPGAANNTTLSGTTTSTAEGIQGPSGRHTHFPNTTMIFSSYGTASAGGSMVASTASYTLTIPPGAGPTGTGQPTAPPGTTTSQVDPVSTVVTVSSAGKASVSAGLALVVAFAAAWCL